MELILITDHAALRGSSLWCCAAPFITKSTQSFAESIKYRTVTLEEGEICKVFVVEALDPDNIICQPAESAFELTTLMEQLAETYKRKSTLTLNTGHNRFYTVTGVTYCIPSCNRVGPHRVHNVMQGVPHGVYHGCVYFPVCPDGINLELFEN